LSESLSLRHFPWSLLPTNALASSETAPGGLSANRKLSGAEVALRLKLRIAPNWSGEKSDGYVAEMEEGEVYMGTYVSLEDHFPNIAPLFDGIARRVIPAFEAVNFKRRFGSAFLFKKVKSGTS
jgi:hypothetical protein